MKNNTWCRFSPECDYTCSANYYNHLSAPIFIGRCKADKSRSKRPWLVSEIQILVLNEINKKDNKCKNHL